MESNGETTPCPSPYVPVFKLAGSPYEIGFQHGQQAKKYIASNTSVYCTWLQETAGFSWTEAKQRATTFVPTLQRLYPEILDEIQDVADGAGLERDDILVINIRSEIGLTSYDDSPPSQDTPAITDGCTALAQSSHERSKTILAQNWDWIEGLENGIIVVDITTDKGMRMQFMNEAGLFVVSKRFKNRNDCIGFLTTSLCFSFHQKCASSRYSAPLPSGSWALPPDELTTAPYAMVPATCTSGA